MRPHSQTIPTTTIATYLFIRHLLRCSCLRKTQHCCQRGTEQHTNARSRQAHCDACGRLPACRNVQLTRPVSARRRHPRAIGHCRVAAPSELTFALFLSPSTEVPSRTPAAGRSVATTEGDGAVCPNHVATDAQNAANVRQTLER